MKKKLLILLTLMFFAPFMVNAEELKMDWQKNFGDFGLYEEDSVLLTEDGGFVYITCMEDIIITKTDKDGNMLWQKSWGGNGDDLLINDIVTKDDGFIVFGDSTSTDIEGLTNKGHADDMIVKYDKDGNMIWQKSWGGNGDDWLANAIVTEDDGFIVFGNSTSTDIEGLTNKGGCDIVIVKYDKDGKMLWQKSWGGNGDDWFTRVFLTKNNGFIVLGNSTSTDIEGIINTDDVVGIKIKYSIEYNLEVVATENGTSTVEEKGKYGIVTPIPNEGYEVSEIVIKDKNGNVLELEVTKLEDGTYSFPINDDVTVEVLFKEKLENPKTGMSNIIGLMFTVALCFISGFFVLKNYNKNYEL